MTPRPTLVAILLVTLLFHEAIGIGFPSLFGSRVTKKDVEKNDTKEDVPKEEQDHIDQAADRDGNNENEPHKPTRRPIIPGIPHPADHSLHHHNIHDYLPHLPHLPSLPSLELPNLSLFSHHHNNHHHHIPHLPPLPSLPHFTRETIHATKTVFVEVTDKVTVHPVCMTVYKLTAPCLPYNPHVGVGGWRDGEVVEGDENPAEARGGVQNPKIQPTTAPLLITPTATAAVGDYINLEPTRVWGGETISDASLSPSEPDDSTVDPLEFEEQSEKYGNDERNGRWVKLTPPIKIEEPVKLKDDQHHDEEPSPAENSGPLNVVHQLINRTPVTHYKTKTLWVTKVEKVLDTRVTATLIAKNCIPTNSHIPYCAPHGGLLGPGIHGEHYGSGSFFGSLGGVFLPGFTDKVDDQEPGASHPIHPIHPIHTIHHEEEHTDDEVVLVHDPAEDEHDENTESEVGGEKLQLDETETDALQTEQP